MHFDQPLAERLDRAALFPGGNIVLGAVSKIAHPFGMWPGAIGTAFEERRTAASSRAGNRLGGRGVDGQHVVAIDGRAGHAVRSGPSANFR
jgi:hypothetical protein